MNSLDFSLSQLQIVLASQAIAPPCTLLHVDMFRQMAAQLVSEAVEVGADWWPLVLPSVEQIERDALSQLGVRNFCEAFPPFRLEDGGGPHLVLIQPPVSPPVLGPLGQLSQQGKLRGVVCDHFAQAEVLALVGRRTGNELPSLVRIGFGPDRWGVFPGRELEQLAAGIEELAGVSIEGLYLPDRQAPNDGGLIAEDAEFIRLASKGLDSINWKERSPRLIVDTFRTARLLKGALPAARLAVRESVPEAYRAVIANVVARPLMDLAILNVGRGEVGGDAQLVGLRQWEIHQIGEYSTSLRRLNAGESLVIGDAVCLAIAREFAPPPYLPRLRWTNEAADVIARRSP